MKPQPKSATCCFCGRRTVLVLSARAGHELACASCGAPLHVMKPLRTGTVGQGKRDPLPPATKGRRRRKTSWVELVKDIVDEIEDIFD